MGAIVSSAACCAGEAACCLSCMCCSRIMSMCCSCGSGSSSPSIGRKSSVALLLFGILLSLALQYFIIPNTPVNSHLNYAWECDDLSDEFQEVCRSNSGVLRVATCTFIFFILAAIVAAVSPAANRNFWGMKIIVYLLLILASMFVPIAAFDEHGFLQIARIGGAIFVVIQQIILIDLAYNWNDAWVANADEAERDLMGGGDSWLKGLLALSVTITLGAYTGLGFLFHFFGGCPANDAFLWITLVLTLMATAFQLTGDEGSVLTSAVMTAYSVFLAYSAVSNNPDGTCNPMLGEDNWLDITLGLAFILGSMAWTCFSYASSVTEMFSEERGSGNKSLIDEESGAKTTGVVAGGDRYGATSEGADKNSAGDAFAAARESLGSGDFDHSQAWKLNLVLALMALWYPMVLTSWGQIKSDGSAANPTIGGAAMWCIIVGQWLALALYIWTLVAPRLFPDRDFS